MGDIAWDVFPFWLRGWGWWTFSGVLHELDKILSHPTPSVLEVLLAIVEVTESGVSETRQDKQSTYEFSLQYSHILKETSGKNKENNQTKFVPMNIILGAHCTVNGAIHSSITNLINKTSNVCNY